MGLRFILSHRLTVLVAACCAVICTIGCGSDEPDVTASVPAAGENVTNDTATATDTQYVSSSQSSGDIDFNDLSGSRQQSPTNVSDEPASDDTSSSSISADLTVIAEKSGLEKFPNGAAKKRYKIRLMSDKSVVLHGPYIEYHANGKQFKRGSYTNGLQDGRWGYWHDNGQVAKYGRYKLGEHDGKWVYRSREGLTRRVENYTAGKRNGNWLFYQKDVERLRRQVEWKDDVREGTTIDYFPDGQRKVSTEWKNDKLDGRVLKWHKDGKKLSYEEYKDGKRNGRAIMWSQSGTVQADMVYRDDRRVSGG